MRRHPEEWRGERGRSVPGWAMARCRAPPIAGRGPRGLDRELVLTTPAPGPWRALRGVAGVDAASPPLTRDRSRSAVTAWKCRPPTRIGTPSQGLSTFQPCASAPLGGQGSYPLERGVPPCGDPGRSPSQIPGEGELPGTEVLPRVVRGVAKGGALKEALLLIFQT